MLELSTVQRVWGVCSCEHNVCKQSVLVAYAFWLAQSEAIKQMLTLVSISTVISAAHMSRVVCSASSVTYISTVCAYCMPINFANLMQQEPQKLNAVAFLCAYRALTTSLYLSIVAVHMAASL